MINGKALFSLFSLVIKKVCWQCFWAYFIAFFISCALYFQPHEVSASFDIVLQCIFDDFLYFSLLRPRGLLVSSSYGSYVIVNGYQLLCDAHTALEQYRGTAALTHYHPILFCFFHPFGILVCLNLWHNSLATIRATWILFLCTVVL